MKNPFKKIEKDKPIRLKKRNLIGGENTGEFQFTDEHDEGLELWQRKKRNENWIEYTVRYSREAPAGHVAPERIHRMVVNGLCNRYEPNYDPSQEIR